MIEWLVDDVITFPEKGDNRDVPLDVAGLDFQNCTYTVQPGDQGGPLTALLYPGQTSDPPPIPGPGGIIQIPPYACDMLRHAVHSGVVSGVPEPTVRWLGALPTPSPIDRSRVTALVRKYTGGSVGDPLFEEVTQGRADAKGYSACGDLINFVLYRIGCRDPGIVNRAESQDGLKWHITENLGRPVSGAKRVGAWVPYKKGLLPRPGDLYLIGQWPDEIQHMGVVLRAGPSSWLTADYGGVNELGQQSSGIGERAFDGTRLGKLRRRVQGWIDIDLIPKTAAARLPAGKRKGPSPLELGAVLILGAVTGIYWI